MADHKHDGLGWDHERIPLSDSVQNMSPDEVYTWITRLIGSVGACGDITSRRTFLRKYLRKREQNKDFSPPPASSSVDEMSAEDVRKLLSDTPGSLGDCVDLISQRQLKRTYLRKGENEMEKGTIKHEEANKSTDRNYHGHYHEKYSTCSTEEDEISFGCDFQGDVNRNDGKETEGQIIRTNASCLDKYEFQNITRMMEMLEIKCTESNNKNRDILKKHLFSGEWRGSQSERVKDVIDLTITKYEAFKKELSKSFESFSEIVETDLFQEECDGPVKETYPNYIWELQQRRKKLEHIENKFEIVVTGETSAGKSAFLNVLLGCRILPSAHLHLTSCLCRLHNSKDRMLYVTNDDGSINTMCLTDDPNEVNSKLRSIVGPIDGDEKPLKVVDIYWPIPLLQKNIVLIDTPGISEKNDLAKKVVKYVTNASGYIIVLDSSRAGGIQENGIVQLFKEIILSCKMRSDEKNFSNVLFVCNKWDTIERNEWEDVWNDINKKLISYFGIVLDWQVVRFNAKLELELLDMKANPTPAFNDILNGVEELMMHTINNKIDSHYRWIRAFVVELQMFVDTMISAQSLKTEELHRRISRADEKLDQAKRLLEQHCKELETSVRGKKQCLLDHLKTYLNDDERKSKVCNWNHNTAPKYEDVGKKGSQLIEQRIQKVIAEWIKDGPLKQYVSEMTTMHATKKEEIESCFHEIYELEIGFPTLVNAEEDIYFTAQEKAAMIILSPLIIVCTLVCLVIGIVAIPFVLFSSRSAGDKSVKAMQKMAAQAMKSATKGKSLDRFISDCFEDPQKEIISIFKNQCMRRIKLMHTTLDEIKQDSRSKSKILDVYGRLQQQIETPSLCVLKLGLEYNSRHSVSLESLELQGSFSNTDMSHLYAVKGYHQGSEVTLRVIHSNYSTFHIQHFKDIRSLEHKNFVSHRGVVFSISPEADKTCCCTAGSLKVLIEPCIDNLENYVFPNPRRHGCVVGDSAEPFFLRMASGIMDALFYIHQKNFVHGHLELSSVLLTPDVIPKLCDIEIRPQRKRRIKCMYHTAPEVLLSVPNKVDKTSDIYSFGTLLWELWYGRHIKVIEASNKTSCIRKTPQFVDKSPKKSIISLIQQCWSENPSKRPSANVWSKLYK